MVVNMAPTFRFPVQPAEAGGILPRALKHRVEERYKQCFLSHGSSPKSVSCLMLDHTNTDFSFHISLYANLIFMNTMIILKMDKKLWTNITSGFPPKYE